MQSIYLDHNSTTPIDPRVVDAMTDCQKKGYVNPASQHRMGQEARARLEFFRSEMVEMLGGQSSGLEADRLIFTSGGTESNHLALLGLLLDGHRRPLGRALVSAIEHPSITGAAECLRRSGVDIDVLPVNQSGVLKLDQLEKAIDQPARLVSVMAANNETGVVQPIRQVVERCTKKSILVHTDAVQAVGKVPAGFSWLGVDAMSLTAHKFHGPRGIGGLLVKNGLSLNPIVGGGFQQMGIRPGTEDVALVAGFHRALQLYQEEAAARQQRTEGLRDQLQARILSDCSGAVVVGAGVARTPNCLNVSFPGIDRQAFLLAADMRGLAISTGSACASGSSDPSPVLLAMGLDRATVEGSIRLSLGHQTTDREINLAADRISFIYKDLLG
ncbi:MAG: cysteine desulfurase [Mariniblastus sp.]|nr:cysteine desulfurase [Mariniblastus sp.]